MKFSNLLLTAFVLLSSGSFLQAQGLVDGFFSRQGDFSLTTGYTRGSAEKFYAGETEMPSIPVHGEFTQDIISFYAKYGLTDDLTLVASLPFISIKGDSVNVDPFNGNDAQADFQNLSVALKYRFAEIETSTGGVNLFAGLTGSVAGDYVNNGIIAIGNGANALDLSAGFQYQLNTGWFASAVGTYSLRGEADNDFGVGDGDDFDVPNAFLGLVKLGYAGGKFYADAYYDFQSSTDGIDIGSETFAGNFPETEVNFSRLGASVYYALNNQFGVSLSASRFLGGRNVSQFTYLGGGVTYGFNTRN